MNSEIIDVIAAVLLLTLCIYVAVDALSVPFDVLVAAVEHIDRMVRRTKVPVEQSVVPPAPVIPPMPKLNVPCPCCGAKVQYRSEQEFATCPRCGCPVDVRLPQATF